MLLKIPWDFYIYISSYPPYLTSYLNIRRAHRLNWWSTLNSFLSLFLTVDHLSNSRWQYSHLGEGQSFFACHILIANFSPSRLHLFQQAYREQKTHAYFVCENKGEIRLCSIHIKCCAWRSAFLLPGLQLCDCVQ